MKMYQTPSIEVQQLYGESMLMKVSPSGDIEGTPDQGLNVPGGKGNAPVRPF